MAKRLKFGHRARLALLILSAAGRPLDSLAEGGQCASAPGLVHEVAGYYGAAAVPQMRCVELPDADYHTALRNSAQRWVNKDRLQAEAAAYPLLTLTPKSFDYLHCMDSDFVADVAAFYAPQDKSLIIRGSANIERQTLVHEVIRAFQDKQFRLDTLVNDSSGTTDSYLAKMAVIEGDSLLGEQAIGAASTSSASSQSALPAAAPGGCNAATLVSRLYDFPFRAGPVFLTHLSGGWNAAQRAAVFAKPPLSTREILHPELYPRAAKPVTVECDDPGEPVLRDELGEYALRLLLLQHLGAERARTLAAGWEADRLTVKKEPDGAYHVCWNIVLASAQSAAEVRAKVFARPEMKALTAKVVGSTLSLRAATSLR